MKLPIELDKEIEEIVLTLMRQQSCIVRSSYVNTSKGMTELENRHKIKTHSLGSYIDSHWMQSAIKRGISLYKADKSLNMPNRMFGGHKNLENYRLNKITKQEYQDNKIEPFRSIGQALPKGNLKFSFYKDYISLKVNINFHIKINLPKLKKNYQEYYNQILDLTSKRLIPITVAVDTKFLYITFDEQKVKKYRKVKSKKSRYAAIDMNPREMGITICDYKNGEHKIIATRVYSLANIVNAKNNHGKNSNESILIAQHIGKFLDSHHVENLYLEELSKLPSIRSKNKRFNRLINNNWKRTKIENILGKYYNIKFINPSYSSTIGNLIYPMYPDPIAASLEIGRRAYEVYNGISKTIYPALINKVKLEERWKQTEFPDYKTWKELHDFIKKTKVEYRIPLPKAESFKLLGSWKSNCLVLDI